jgi:hypothetical protein
MTATDDPADWRRRKIRDWLLQLLRFAITQEASDHASAVSMADEMDAVGLRWRPSGSTFFVRTTEEVCRAIVSADDPTRLTVLQRHARLIDDPRLRRAFEDVVGIGQISGISLGSSSELTEVQPKRRMRRSGDLWKGLRGRAR